MHVLWQYQEGNIFLKTVHDIFSFSSSLGSSGEGREFCSDAGLISATFFDSFNPFGFFVEDDLLFEGMLDKILNEIYIYNVSIFQGSYIPLYQ